MAVRDSEVRLYLCRSLLFLFCLSLVNPLRHPAFRSLHHRLILPSIHWVTTTYHTGGQRHGRHTIQLVDGDRIHPHHTGMLKTRKIPRTISALLFGELVYLFKSLYSIFATSVHAGGKPGIRGLTLTPKYCQAFGATPEMYSHPGGKSTSLMSAPTPQSFILLAPSSFSPSCPHYLFPAFRALLPSRCFAPTLAG